MYSLYGEKVSHKMFLDPYWMFFSFFKNKYLKFVIYMSKDMFLFCYDVMLVKTPFKMAKCAISTNAQNQDGRPDRYWKLKKRMKESAKANPPHPHPGT